VASKPSTGKRRASRNKASKPASGDSLSGWVYQELRKKVVDGQLRPGDRMREVELSNTLRVSRTPVREALKRLEADGWLKYLPSRGAVINSLEPEQAAELYAVREILEASAARLAAQNASEYEIELLKGVLQRQKEAKDDIEALARLNRIFHSTIYRMSHNRYLFDILCRTQDYMLLLAEKSPYGAPGRPRAAYQEHAAIVEAIARHDPDAAEAASRRHSREALRSRMLHNLELAGMR
jgi:DNA-binding GntR family transcriptional regulator